MNPVAALDVAARPGRRLGHRGRMPVLRRLFRYARWTVLGLALGGTLLQSSCTSGFALSVAGLFSSIANELIRNTVNELLGVPSSFIGF